MYNLYRFEQDALEEEKRLNQAKSMKILKRHRKQERNKMVQKYKKRVTDFVTTLEKAPIKPPDEYLQKLNQEEQNRRNNKFMGNESMMYSVRSENERIKEGKTWLKWILAAFTPSLASF